MTEPAKVLSIGSVIGGATAANRGWVDAIRVLTREIASRRAGIQSDINVNVEFHVPGNILAPDFDGVRTGYFRKRDRLLKVQVALPATAPDDPRAALIEAVGAALDATDDWALKKGQSIDTHALRTLLADFGTHGDHG